VLAEVLRPFAVGAHQKALRWSASATPTCHRRDRRPVRFQQIVGNLVWQRDQVHGARARPRRGAEEARAEGSTTLHVSVTDTGDRVPKDKQAACSNLSAGGRIATRRFGGTGLA